MLSILVAFVYVGASVCARAGVCITEQRAAKNRGTTRAGRRQAAHVCLPSAPSRRLVSRRAPVAHSKAARPSALQTGIAAETRLPEEAYCKHLLSATNR